MIEPLPVKFVFSDQSTGLDGLRRISYVSGGGVHPLPLQLCVTTANCVVGLTRVEVSAFVTLSVRVEAVALAIVYVPLFTGDPVMSNVSLGVRPKPSSSQLPPVPVSMRTIWSPPSAPPSTRT